MQYDTATRLLPSLILVMVVTVSVDIQQQFEASWLFVYLSKHAALRLAAMRAIQLMFH